MPGVFVAWRALKIALPMAIILGLALAFWLAKRDANAWHIAYTAAVAAGAAAEQKQIALNGMETARQRTEARLSDERYQNALESAGEAAKRYIREHAAGRMCAQSGGAERRADPVPEAGDSGISENAAPAYPVLVEIPAADVEACAANHVYAQAAYEWTRSLDQGAR